MSQYSVKIGFWLRALEGFTIEADTDAESIERAKAAALLAMESSAFPGHIDLDDRREGIIAYIDRVTDAGPQAIADDVKFDDDRIHSPAPSA